MNRRRLLLWLGLVLSLSCASPPRTTPEARALFANARAVVEGQVLDGSDRPIADIAVTAIPRSRDVEWSPPATTDGDGRFTLTLFAPGDYAFFLSQNGLARITPEADDPVRVIVSLRPGERRTGILLRFHRAAD